jgi:hypothetical protein
MIFIRQRNYSMMVKSTSWERVTYSKTLRLHFNTFLRHATKIQVNRMKINNCEFVDMAAAYHWRGRCYQGMGDF